MALEALKCKMEIIRIDKASSTNTWVTEREAELSNPTLVYCDCQTAGRGQRGNSWESEPGMNITASVLYRPQHINATEQFRISEAVALAIADFLEDFGVEIKVKWPNDVYSGNRKICGILIEHMIMGKNINRTVIGFGININQTKFISDAPNPVSLKMLTGKSYDIEEIVEKLSEKLERNLEEIERGEDLHQEFLKRLWRGDGKYYDFIDRKKGEKIRAYIVDITSQGILRLRLKEDENRDYAFKEVEFVM